MVTDTIMGLIEVE